MKSMLHTMRSTLPEEKCRTWQRLQAGCGADAPLLDHAVRRGRDERAAVGRQLRPAHARIVPLQRAHASAAGRVPHQGAVVAWTGNT